MTVTDKVLAANRANARKSTGPRTKRGKDRVPGHHLGLAEIAVGDAHRGLLVLQLREHRDQLLQERRKPEEQDLLIRPHHRRNSAAPVLLVRTNLGLRTARAVTPPALPGLGGSPFNLPPGFDKFTKK